MHEVCGNCGNRGNYGNTDTGTVASCFCCTSTGLDSAPAHLNECIQKLKGSFCCHCGVCERVFVRTRIVIVNE